MDWKALAEFAMVRAIFATCSRLIFFQFVLFVIRPLLFRSLLLLLWKYCSCALAGVSWEGVEEDSSFPYFFINGTSQSAVISEATNTFLRYREKILNAPWSRGWKVTTEQFQIVAVDLSLSDVEWRSWRSTREV